MKIILEQTVEIRFKANSRMLDRRGEITNALTNESLTLWNISNNSIEIKSEENDKIRGFFGFRNAGFVSSFPTPKDQFVLHAKEHIKKSWPFIPLNEIERIGMSTKILVPKEEFTKYFEAYRDKFYRLTEAQFAEFGGKLVDLAVRLNFSEGLKQFNTVSGPVEKEEYEKFFKDLEEDVPEYGIYCELDYFTTEIPPHIKQKDVLDMIDVGIEKAERFADTVLSTIEK